MFFLNTTGTPATITLSGTFLATTDPAATYELSHTNIWGKIKRLNQFE
jgi:hypothetical protein